jgi:hypothetical protein
METTVIFYDIDCLDIISKNDFISNNVKIRLVRSEFFHADKRTDKQDAGEVVLRMFAKVPPISGIVSM